MALLLLLVGGCGNGVRDADIDALKAQITKAFKKKDQTVTEMFLTRDSAYQVSGMIHVKVESPMGERIFYTPCAASMDPTSRDFSWKCESVP
jgi:hypothetical protein